MRVSKEKKEDQFLKLYKQLNPAQKEAVDSIEGPVMVVAGPGTGKTQVLGLRIANILRRTDTPPDAILALTFTNAGVQAMRERLTTIIGSAAYRAAINTFHGFCNEIINRYPEEFPRIIGAQNATRVEQIKIAEQVIAKARLKLLRPYGAPFYYLSAALEAIEKLKKENVTPTQLTKMAIGPKEKELALIYRVYEQALRQARLYDFADMIMEVLTVLKKKKIFLRRLQEEYLYILADEHQDANQSQNELLALLANYHENPNLFIVGDEKQAIFQFQGASLDNFNYFKKLYPTAKLIRLTENYRATQTLLDAAHHLISQSNLPAEVLTPLRSQNSQITEKIKVTAAANLAVEQRFVAEDIKMRLKAGVVPEEIAVIYRDNADAEALVAALERAGLLFVIESQSDLLNDITISKLILILETIHHFGADDFLFRFLHLDFLHLEPLKIYELLEQSRKQKKSLYLLLGKTAGVLGQTYRQLEKWRRLAHNQNLLNLFGAVLEESGFLDYLLKSPAAEEKLAKLEAFHEELKEFSTAHANFNLADFIDYLETLKRHGLGLLETAASGRDGVRLMTAHRSKGLEFDYVYIIGANDGHFGGRRKRSAFSLPLRGNLPNGADDDGPSADEASERRLFYVALTRARRGVTITYARQTRDGRAQSPSQFIEEMTGLVDFTEVGDRGAKPIAARAANLRPRPATPTSLTEKAYLNKLFLERGLSVTDLNNYLACPRHYFYVNLLRLPQVQNKHLLYGTAMHQTLKEFFDHYREGKKWAMGKLLTRFQYHLARQPFSADDLKSSREKGRLALTGYLRWYKYQWPNNIINEFNIRGLILSLGQNGGEIKLNGKIDKLELASGASGLVAGEVRVVDYKTGQPKTRNHILGLTKSAGAGDYFRQLVFYKLLLDNYSPKYEVTSGLIDFIEPDPKGRYHQEEFSLAAQDSVGLKELITEVAASILDLKFLTRGCGQKDCDWCRLWMVTH